MDPVAPAIPEGTGPSFASGGTVQYSVKRLGKLPGDVHASANDINDVGQVAGSSTGPGGTARAVMWQQGVVVNLGVPTNSVALGISPNGTVVGYRTDVGAFRWTASTGAVALPNLLGGPSTSPTIAWAVNGQGTVVGHSTTSAGVQHAVKWSSSGTIADIHPTWASASGATDVNEEGWISGYATDPRTTNTRAVVWSPGGAVISLGTVPGFPGDHTANGLNESVEVVGFASTTSGFTPQAVRWAPPPLPFGTTILPCPSMAISVAKEISNLGRSVGWCATPNNGNIPGRAWTARNGSAQMLTTWLGAFYTQARAVNSCGTAVGYIDTEAVIWTRINTAGPSGAPICDQ